MALATSAPVQTYLRGRKRRRFGSVALHRSMALLRGEIVVNALTTGDLTRPITFGARVEAGNGQPALTIGSAIVVTFAGGNLVLSVSGNSAVVTPFAVGRIGEIVVALRPADDRYKIWVDSRAVAQGSLSSGFVGGNLAAITDDLTAGPSVRSQLSIYKGATPVGFDA